MLRGGIQSEDHLGIVRDAASDGAFQRQAASSVPPSHNVITDASPD